MGAGWLLANLAALRQFVPKFWRSLISVPCTTWLSYLGHPALLDSSKQADEDLTLTSTPPLPPSQFCSNWSLAIPHAPLDDSAHRSFYLQ